MGFLVDNPIDEIFPLTVAKLTPTRWFAYHTSPRTGYTLSAEGVCPRDAALNLAHVMEGSTRDKED